MEIIDLMNKQSALECEVAEMERRFPLKDKEECLRFAAAKKEFDALEEQICAKVKDVADNPSLNCSQSVENFANAINDAAEQGMPIEDVLFGKDSILDPTTVSCLFKLFRSEDGLVVMGGEMVAQCKDSPWLLVKVSEECVDMEIVWQMSHRGVLRPRFKGAVCCCYHQGGAYQRGVLAFFRREYARQQERQVRNNTNT